MGTLVGYIFFSSNFSFVEKKCVFSLRFKFNPPPLVVRPLKSTFFYGNGVKKNEKWKEFNPEYILILCCTISPWFKDWPWNKRPIWIRFNQSDLVIGKYRFSQTNSNQTIKVMKLISTGVYIRWLDKIDLYGFRFKRRSTCDDVRALYE